LLWKGEDEGEGPNTAREACESRFCLRIQDQ
jgi:hypothetical protein